MKSRQICLYLSFLFVVYAAGPCVGQTKSTDRVMSLDEMKARVIEAHTRKKEVTVMLQGGSNITGTVSPVSDATFELTQTLGLFGERDDVLTLRYSDVARMKPRNQFVKVLQDIGTGSLVVVGIAALLPVWAVFQGLSLLITGKPLSGC